MNQFSSKEPLYYYIKNDLIRKIQEGAFDKDGSKFPSEPDLQKEYRASRGTVRRALLDLQMAGFIVRRSGKPTRVASRQGRATQEHFGLRSFSEKTRAAGGNPKSRVLDKGLAHVGDVDPFVGSGFGITAEQQVIFIKRLRIQNRTPVAIQTVYLLPERCPKILEKDLSELFRLYWQEYGVRLISADESLELGFADTNNAELLKIKPGDPVVVRRRVSLDENNTPFEVLYAVEIPQRFTYDYRIVAEGTKPSNSS